MLSEPLAFAARALEVEEPRLLRLWLWRLFVRPAPARAGRAGRMFDAALSWLARSLAVTQPERPGHWGSRITRLARTAMHTPLAEDLKGERNLFMDLMTTDWAIDAMKAYVRSLEEQK